MSVRTLTDRDTDETVLYNSCTMTAFGPVFESEAHAEAFLAWVSSKYGWYVGDVRELQACQLDELYSRWLKVWRHNEPLPKGSRDLQFIALCRAYIRAGFDRISAWSNARYLVLKAHTNG